MREAGFGIKAATITPEGKDDVGSPNRILREEVDGKVIIRTGRRIPGVVGPVVGRALPDLRRAHGGRRRLRRRAVARGRGGLGRRGRATARSGSRAASAAPWPSSPSAPPSAPGARVYGGPEVDGLPRLRGHAQGGDGRGRRAPSRRRLPAGADRRHVRGAADRRRRRAAGDPGAQPRRRLPVGPRDADVRLDRRRRVDPARLRRRLRGRRRDGRGAARHGAVAAGQGRRQPDGDDPRLRRRARPGRRAQGFAGAERASRAIYESDARDDGGRRQDVRPRRPAPTTTEFTDAVVEKVRTKIEIWSSLGSSV